MSRKTIQVSQELHKDLKLRSAQDGVPIPEVIANLLKEGVTSARESIRKTTRTGDREKVLETNNIPDEFWRQLRDDATAYELILMGYKMGERDPDTGVVSFSREEGVFNITIPEEELTREEYEEAVKLDQILIRRGLDPRLECVKSKLIEWRMLIRAIAKAEELIDKLEEGLGKRPTPAQYDKVYNDIQTLELAMKDGDYATLKAKVREADPEWKEWTPPAGIQVAKEWLDRLHGTSPRAVISITPTGQAT